MVADDGSELRSRYLVAATGVLSVPFYPDVPGREDFRGVSFHTGLWPASPVDFAGKRVAVIGTGSSGVQIAPVIADEVASLAVYQRSANWCTPLNNAPITPEEQEQLRAGFEAMREVLNTSTAGFLHPANERSAFDDSEDERQAFFETMWRSPGFSKLSSNYADVLFDDAANAEWCEFIAHKVRGIVDDRETADKLIPKDHGFGEKRPPFVTGYYEMYNNPKVSLIDLKETPIGRITEHGHRDGRRRAGVRHHRVGDRVRFRYRCPVADGDPGPGRSRPRRPLGRRSENVPRRTDHRLPQSLLPRWTSCRRRQ